MRDGAGPLKKETRQQLWDGCLNELWDAIRVFQETGDHSHAPFLSASSPASPMDVFQEMLNDHIGGETARQLMTLLFGEIAR